MKINILLVLELSFMGLALGGLVTTNLLANPGAEQNFVNSAPYGPIPSWNYSLYADNPWTYVCATINGNSNCRLGPRTGQGYFFLYISNPNPTERALFQSTLPLFIYISFLFFSSEPVSSLASPLLHYHSSFSSSFPPPPLLAISF